MDIKVESKDILINDKGKLVMIDGIEQIIQQIQFALTIKKGSFIYDRNMGTDISKDILETENGSKILQSLIYESLINVPNVTVLVKYLENRDEKVYAGIIVSDSYETKETEVIVFEYI